MPRWIGAACDEHDIYIPQEVEADLEADAARKLGEYFGFINGPREICPTYPPHVWTQPADHSRPRRYWAIWIRRSMYVSEHTPSIDPYPDGSPTIH